MEDEEFNLLNELIIILKEEYQIFDSYQRLVGIKDVLKALNEKKNRRNR